MGPLWWRLVMTGKRVVTNGSPFGRIREMSVKSRTEDSNESFLRALRDLSPVSSACGIEFFVADAGFQGD
jgi:hypothetical protein